MAEIINLRLARKAKTKSAKETKAAENRVAFGRTKAEKSLIKSETDRASRKLDAHRREGPGGPDDKS